MQENGKDTVERDAISTGIKEVIKELRRQRRWRGLWRLVIIALLGFSIYASFMSGQPDRRLHRNTPHTAVIDIKGVIEDRAAASADHTIQSLEAAFKNTNARGIILRINSPGGSTVQASYIYNAIRRLRNSHKKVKIYAVCSDMCASAAYYIASATDEIYANPLSQIGSIGVLAQGFGYVGALQKLGIERRLFTAGHDKAALDAFSPLTRHAQDQLLTILDQTHQYFIQDVKRGRGKRLFSDPMLFSGHIWLGGDAKKFGLIDHFGSARDVARDTIKHKNMVNYTIKPNYFEQLSNRFSTKLVATLLESISNQPALSVKGVSA